MDYNLKKIGASKYARKYQNKRIFRRLSDLLYSRQISDQDIANFLDINIEFWFLIKNGKRPPDYIVEMLSGLFGDEIYFIFMGYYIDKLPLEMKWANELS